MAFAHLATASGSGSQTGVTTGNIDTTGAKLIVCSGAFYSGLEPGENPSFTDSASNSWTKLTPRTAGASYTNVLWYVINPTTSSSHNFTLSGANVYASLQGSAFSAGGTVTFEAESAGGTTTADSVLQPGSITPSGDGRVFVTGLVFNFDNTISINSSFTIGAQNDFNTGVAEGGAIAYKIQTTGGAENPTWSWSVNTFAASAMATFVDTGGGGGGGGAIVFNLQIG